MSNPIPDEETEEYIKYNSSVKFTENFKTEKKLIAKGNIDAWDIVAEDIVARDIVAWNISAWDIVAEDIVARDIVAWNIVARNIDARNSIICETRELKAKTCTTKTRTYIKNRSKREYKVQDEGEELI